MAISLVPALLGCGPLWFSVFSVERFGGLNSSHAIALKAKGLFFLMPWALFPPMMETLAAFAKDLGTWSVKIVEMFGYPGVFLLMAMESSIFPVPSELVMPPAGYLAAQGEMNLIVVILLGTLGSMAGALANYTVAAWLGRAFLLRYGRWVLCPPKKLEKLEEFFVAHGAMGTFTGRLIPGVRHFISLPAGLVRMPMTQFLILTGLGSLLWVTILTLIGFYVGKNIDRIKELAHTAVVWSVIGVGILLVAYFLWHKHKRKPLQKKPSSQDVDVPE